MKNIVVISDTHFGGSTALAYKHQLDDGGFYEPSDLQKKLNNLWDDFWGWAFKKLGGEPFTLVHVGDIVDGNHHNTTALTSGNPASQARLAEGMMGSIIKQAEAYYQIRGTEAHVGQSACNEENIARQLGAVRSPEGHYARWELWMKADEELIHFSHHIGNTSSSAYESSALRREMVAAYEDCGQWNRRPPTILIRGHTHRFIRVEDAHMIGIKLPGWQAKTPFTYKIDRLRGPMFGGILIRTRDGERASIGEQIYSLKQTESVTI